MKPYPQHEQLHALQEEIYKPFQERRQSIARVVVANLLREVEISWRMMADNFLATIPSALLMTLAVCFRNNLTVETTVLRVGQCALLFILYLYVFDTSNQARSVEEDRSNKPYRPLPMSLVTQAGLHVRLSLALPVYIILGWKFGVLPWVLLWIADVILLNIVCSHRNYLWSKPISMITGVTAQIGCTWQLVQPLDQTAWRWVAVLALIYPLGLVFEDVRDMAGDREIGRRTPALVFGHWPIRVWSASIAVAIPFIAHLLLFGPADVSEWRIVLSDLIVATACWTFAIRAVLLRNHPADRVTYQLYILSYVLVIGMGSILWV